MNLQAAEPAGAPMQVAGDRTLAGEIVRQLGRMHAGEEADVAFDWFLDQPASAIPDLGTVLHLYRLAERAGREADLDAFLTRAIDNGALERLPVASGDRLWTPGGSETRRAISDRLKYGPDGFGLGNMAGAARFLAGQLVIEEKMIAASHAITATGLARADWERSVRLSTAYDHALRELVLDDKQRSLYRLCDDEQMRAAVAPYLGERLLCLFHHGGYVLLARVAFGALFPDGSRMQNQDAQNERQIKNDDPVLALFRALRTLQDDKALLIAVDAPAGRANASITAAGITMAVPSGAAFLAFETRCRSIWFNVVRAGDRFRLDVAPIEPPGEAETFVVFRARFFAAFSAELDRTLRGSPDNLVMRNRWPRAIARVGRPGRRPPPTGG